MLYAHAHASFGGSRRSSVTVFCYIPAKGLNFRPYFSMSLSIDRSRFAACRLYIYVSFIFLPQFNCFFAASQPNSSQCQRSTSLNRQSVHVLGLKLTEEQRSSMAARCQVFLNNFSCYHEYIDSRFAKKSRLKQGLTHKTCVELPNQIEAFKQHQASVLELL